VNSERFTLPFQLENLACALDWPAGAARGSAILLAHGMGYHLDSPWMEACARGLVAHGFPVLRFNYPYRQRSMREQKELPPDRAPVLEEAHALALGALAERAGARRLLLAGKSLGGRIATHLAAKGERCHGLVLYGYPLHPPGRPEKLRHEHFPAIAQPALFLQGTRDEFAALELLRPALARFGGRATLEVVEGADHGFSVPKRSGRTDEEVRTALHARVSDWERDTFPD
jgi:hypothetical protein